MVNITPLFNNGSVSIETTYSNDSVNSFVVTQLQEQSELINSFYATLQENIFNSSETMYKIIDLFFIKRYFDNNSGLQYDNEPLYTQGYDDTTNEMMRQIFIQRSFSLKDFLVMVYESAGNTLDPAYAVSKELKTYLNKILIYYPSTDIIVNVNLSSESQNYTSVGSQNIYPLYDFLLNEINNLINLTNQTVDTLNAENLDLNLSVDAEKIANVENLYSILNFLNLFPTLISDKQALTDEVVALEQRLDRVIADTLTTTSVVKLQLEAETDIDFIFAIYVRLFGSPQNGVFDTEKINFLRFLSPNDLYAILQSVPAP